MHRDSKAEKIAFSITAAASILADGLKPEEIALLSSAFMQLADVLNTISAVRALEFAQAQDAGDSKQDPEDIKDENQQASSSPDT